MENKEKLTLPYATHLGIEVISEEFGKSHLQLNVKPFHINRHRVIAGGVLYTMADVGMGLAIYPKLNDGQLCATVEIKISYFNAAKEGVLDCHTTIIKSGSKMTFCESEIYCGEVLLAKASGCYLIFTPSSK